MRLTTSRGAFGCTAAIAVIAAMIGLVIGLLGLIAFKVFTLWRNSDT